MSEKNKVNQQNSATNFEYRAGSYFLLVAAFMAAFLLVFGLSYLLATYLFVPYRIMIPLDLIVLGGAIPIIIRYLVVQPFKDRYDRLSLALVESEQKANSIFKTSSSLIISLNENGVIIDCNKRSENILGYAVTDIIGESALKIVHSDYISKAHKILRSMKNDTPIYNRELKMIRADGSLIDVYVNSSALKDRHKNFIMAVWIIDDITLRKKTEATLELTQFSIDRSLDSVYWMSSDAKFIHVNEAACKALGYTREELLEMSIYDIDPQLTPDIWISHWVDLKHRKSFVFEMTHKTRDGKLLQVEVAANYVEYQGQEYNCAFAREISDRKKTENELKEVNYQLRTSIEHMPIAYILWDSHFCVREWNHSAERIFGFGREEVLGKKLPDLIVPWKKKEESVKFLNQLMRGMPVEKYQETPNIRKDGSLVICQWHFSPLRNKDGEVFAVLSMAEDVSEKIRVQRELEKVNRKFRELTEMLPQTVFELNTDGYVIYANKFGFEFTGYTPKDLLGGIKAFEMFAPKDRRKLKKYMVRILRGQKIEGTEFEILKKNGGKANVVVFANPIYDESRLVGVRGIMADITENKRLNEFAARAQRLEIAGRIAGQVAHDFNNLLGPLFAFPEFIKESLPDDDPAMIYLDHIEKAAEQMARINQQLLTLGRRGHYNQVPIDFSEMILQTLEQLQPLPNTVSIHTQLPRNLKKIVGGAAQISRMISNIILNSRESMNDSGVIHIKAENYKVDKVWTRYGRVPQGDYVKLTITDTGPGIPDDVLPHIFEPFYTTKSADSKRGSGLGLSIVQAVVEDHNGFIDVKSDKGKGTSFYIYFPITEKNYEASENDMIVGGQETVLVIDDDPIQREVTVSLLRKLGYKISVAESGEKAVEFIKDHPQDLILLDMKMDPGIDGAETFARIIKIHPDQKALIVSGYADSEKIEKTIELGAMGFVGKPLSLKSAANAVRDVLNGKKVNV